MDEYNTQLKRLGVTNVQIVPFFDTTQEEATNQVKLCALPAGWSYNDKVLPTEEEEPWVDVIFKEVIKHIDPNASRALLQYRYGRELIRRALRALLVAGAKVLRPHDIFEKIQHEKKRSTQ